MIEPVTVNPNYRRNHAGMTILMGVVSLAALIGTMTGPPSFIPPNVWEMITFGSVIVTTFAKGAQSLRGANETA